MTSPSDVRPYYRPETFRSPIKSQDGLIVVYGTSPSSATNDSNAPTTTSANNSQASNFVYLDLDVSSDGVGGIVTSMVQLYMRVLLSQPFEVSTVLLQIGDWSYLRGANTDEKPKQALLEYNGPSSISFEDEEEEEINYFTAAVTGDYELHQRPSHGLESPYDGESVQQVPRNGNEKASNIIVPKSLDVMDIISALNEYDGMRGLWRGFHTTYLIDASSSVVEAWLSSFYSTICGIPDPQVVEVLHSPLPMVALGTVVAASVTTAVLLAPFDIIRTRFIATSLNTQPRSFRTSVSNLSSFWAPSSVLIPTILGTGLSTLIKKSTPYVLFSKLGVNSFNSPTSYNLLTLFSSLFEVFVRLPCQTMTRRAHISTLSLDLKEYIVKPMYYPGVLGSIWDVLTGKYPVASLYRGWRIAVLGAVSEWGVKAIQTNEHKREKF